MKNKFEMYDIIVVGSGMGGMSAASLLASDGFRVLILEASHVPGGCSSSYYRKGYTFEAGATTLIGFDENQPMRALEEKLNINIPKVALNPSMKVYLGEKVITRWQDREKWIDEAIKHFGEAAEQRAFWELSYRISDVVWRVSGKNHFFPPLNAGDWVSLLKNDPRDLWVLPHALKSVRKTAVDIGISNPEFYQFLDEQLIISAQSKSEETPFLFGAPAITYTNYTNYYVPGGLLEMVRALQKYIEQQGGRINTKERVLSIDKSEGYYRVNTSKNRTYVAPTVISNIPVWNMEDITQGEVSDYFKKESEKYNEAWGAYTMGVVTDDFYPDGMSIHHQVHLNGNDKIEGLASDSIFVSMSKRGDDGRAPEGDRVLNISTHTSPEYWFNLNGQYENRKEEVQNQILKVLKEKLPFFKDAEIKMAFSSTPVSWSNWIFRKKGRVGGIPQSMSRSFLDWTPNKTPFEGLYLCGDTVFPGQGIPGVTLSGFNVYYRVQKNHKKFPIH
jgi:C-3',4' desaturase CrtD